MALCNLFVSFLEVSHWYLVCSQCCTMQAQFILRTIALLILTNTTLQNQVAETHTNRKRYQDVPVNPDASDMRPLYPWGTGKPSDICVDGSHPACCAPFLPGTIHLNCGAGKSPSIRRNIIDEIRWVDERRVVFDSDNDKSIAEKCTDFGRYLFFCCRNFVSPIIFDQFLWTWPRSAKIFFRTSNWHSVVQRSSSSMGNWMFHSSRESRGLWTGSIRFQKGTNDKTRTKTTFTATTARSHLPAQKRL